uniref:MHC class I-like antigen recognition-like domain-containing protein n=1 Tax=Capra hircus TaxID=9925 RepID=A0A8C2RUT3_CAPHI
PSLLRTLGNILTVLLCFAFTHAPSLSYNFTIGPQPRPGQPWCEVQGQVGGEVFLSYDCGLTKYMSPLGEEVKCMNAWETQTDTLRDTGVRMLLAGVSSGLPAETGVEHPLTLQARMACRCEDDRHISGSWQFGLNGQMSLHFDLENGHWRVDHPGGRWMKEKWESDRELAKYFRKISTGDCSYWLREFLKHWENILLPEPTGN